MPHWLEPLNLTLPALGPSPTVPLFPITYQYQIRHSSPHTQLIFLPYTVFECRHNIRNQPISTTIPSPRSFHDITTIRKHQHFGKIFKYFFLMFFKAVSHIAKHSTDLPRNIGFHSYSKELVYMCSFYKFVCPLFAQES